MYTELDAGYRMKSRSAACVQPPSQECEHARVNVMLMHPPGAVPTQWSFKGLASFPACIAHPRLASFTAVSLGSGSPCDKLRHRLQSTRLEGIRLRRPDRVLRPCMVRPRRGAEPKPDHLTGRSRMDRPRIPSPPSPAPCSAQRVWKCAYGRKSGHIAPCLRRDC